MEPWAYSPEEEQGVQLAQLVIALFRESGLVHPRSRVPADGPHFVYESNRALFLGRTGHGPLRIAWDTNLLIDYFQCGRTLWRGGTAPEDMGSEQAEQLEALQLVMGLWVLRDIRFHVLPSVLRDSKRKPLPPERRAERVRAWREFTRALALLGEGFDDEPAPPAPPILAVRQALAAVPAGNDRQLVEEALTEGLHVFMTCDKAVLKARPQLAAFGLLIASPQDLLEHLAAAGALECMFYPEQLLWPFPDLQRVTHLMRALP